MQKYEGNKHFYLREDIKDKIEEEEIYHNQTCH